MGIHSFCLSEWPNTRWKARPCSNSSFQSKRRLIQFTSVHSTGGNQNSETPGDSETAFLHWGDVLGSINVHIDGASQTNYIPDTEIIQRKVVPG